ncbi:MAG: hypothetical protein Q4F39_07490 [Bacteroidia bacterium]|nr:hypothetical protein [Bacteroidia bacterium]
MKKIFALSLAALAIAGCNFNANPDEDINYTSKHCIVTDLDGRNISKTEFVETGRAKETSKEYDCVNNSWNFKRKIVTERTFDTYGNTILLKSSFYDASDNLTGVNQVKYEYNYQGTRPADCSIYEEVDGEWVNTQYSIYSYDFGNDIVSSTLTYDLVASSLELPSIKDEYAYSNGSMTNYTRYVIDEASMKWNTLFTTTYTYDQYGRLVTVRTEYPAAAVSSNILTYYY